MAKQKHPAFPDDTPAHAYDRHETARSFLIPTAGALILLGIAISYFLMLLPASQGADERVLAEGLDKLVSLMSKDIAEVSFSQAHIGASLALMSFAIVALVLFRYLADDNREFMAAYPFIEDPYSEAQKRAARTSGAIFAGASALPLIAAIAMACLGASDSPAYHGMEFLLLAVALWLLLHGTMTMRKVDVFAYNYRALEHLSIYELQTEKERPRRKLLMAEKKLRTPAQIAKRAVITAGFLAALALYFLPSIETPFYWLAIVVAIVIRMIIGAFSERSAKALVASYEEPDAR